MDSRRHAIGANEIDCVDAVGITHLPPAILDRGVAGRVDVLKLKGEKQCQIKKTTEYSHVQALVN